MRILIVAIAALAAFTAPTFAQEAQPRSTILSVNAMGVSESRPDMATIHLGVQTSGATAQEALSENSRRMTGLVQALRRAGIAERDIQTAYVSIYPRHRSDRVLDGYTASNSVRARVRNIDAVGRVVDAAVASGGNTVSGISFGYQDPDAEMDRARRDAIEVARERATLYAAAMNMSVVRIISVSEAGAAAPNFDEEIVVTGSRISSSGGAYSPPIAPGELTTRAQVSVSFELR